MKYALNDLLLNLIRFSTCLMIAWLDRLIYTVYLEWLPRNFNPNN